MSDLPNGYTWARKLRVRHLESLLVLEEAGTLTEAATRLHMTQPAMSHWLAEMEALVEAPLIIRGRRLELTLAGELMKQLAISVLGDVAKTGQALNAAAQGKSSCLRIGTVWAGVASLLPRTVACFQQEHPDVSITVTEAPFSNLLEQLARKELDIAVGMLDARAYQGQLVHEILFEDDICIVVGRGSPLWGDTSLHTLKSLADRQWITPQKSTAMRSQLDAAFVDAGIAWITPKVETSAITTLITLLHHGDYIGACSEAMTQVQMVRGTLHRIKIDRRVKFGSVGIVWNKETPSSTVNEFITTAKLMASTADASLES